MKNNNSKKEIPRMFKTEMVKAILAGGKIQTRRMDGLAEINENPDEWQFHGFNTDDDLLFMNVHGHISGNDFHDNLKLVKAHYKKGWRIWVKETFTVARGKNPDTAEMEDRHFVYNANIDPTNTHLIKWKSAMLMPKKAARLWLEITDYRVERLHDITGDDANFEGIRLTLDEQDMAFKGPNMEMYGWDGVRAKYVSKFKELWIKINGAESWVKNPWVNVVTFKRIEK